MITLVARSTIGIPVTLLMYGTVLEERGFTSMTYTSAFMAMNWILISHRSDAHRVHIRQPIPVSYTHLIYAVCGVSQTPRGIDKREEIKMCIRDSLLCLLYPHVGKNQPIIYTLFGARNQPQNVGCLLYTSPASAPASPSARQGWSDAPVSKRHPLCNRG